MLIGDLADQATEDATDVPLVKVETSDGITLLWDCETFSVDAMGTLLLFDDKTCLKRAMAAGQWRNAAVVMADEVADLGD